MIIDTHKLLYELIIVPLLEYFPIAVPPISAGIEGYLFLLSHINAPVTSKGFQF